MTRQKSPHGSLLRFLANLVGTTEKACIEWPFGKNSRGYGVVRYRGHQTSACRVMCVLAHGEPPSPHHEAAHACGNGDCGCVNPRHLRWATPSENKADQVLHGTDNRGERHNMAKLTVGDVREIRASGEASSALAAQFAINPATVRKVRSGRTWQHV